MDVIRIHANDGLELDGSLFEPAQPARSTVLVLPGIGYPRRYFRHVATWLADRGARVLTVDYRGMWGSGGSDGVATASLTRWARADAVGALRFAQARFGGPVALLAHSFGGQMVGFDPAFREVTAVATVGSGFGLASHYDGIMRAYVGLSWWVTLPAAAAAFRRVPGWVGLGAPLPRGVAREWSRWGRSPDWLLSHVDGAAETYARFDRPLLAWRATDDPIASPRATAALLARLVRAPVRYEQIAPRELGLWRIGHGGLVSPAAESLWPRLLNHLVDPPDEGARTGRTGAGAEADRSSVD